MTFNAINLDICEQFIQKYCIPINTFKYDTRDPAIIENDWVNLIIDLSNEHINCDYIANHLRKLNYFSFLHTPYWYIVRNKKLLSDNFLCQLDYKHNNRLLEVHHKTYLYHGYEAQHMDCLTTLCTLCHQSVSPKKIEKKPEQSVNGSYLLEEINKKVEILERKEELNNKINNLIIEKKPVNFYNNSHLVDGAIYYLNATTNIIIDLCNYISA